MNKVTNTLKNIVEWNKREFAISYLSALLVLFLDFQFENFTGEGLLALTVILYQIIFCNKSSLIPFGNNEGFSLKFLTSLPLSRIELFFSIMILSIIRTLPLCVLISIYIHRTLSDYSMIKAFCILFLLLNSLDLTLFQGLIRRPRIEFFNKQIASRMRSLSFQVVLIFFTVASFYVFFFMRLEVSQGTKDFAQFYLLGPLNAVFDLLNFILPTWYAHAAFLLIMAWSIRRFLKEWANEKLSYPKWILSKNSSIAPVCLTILGLLASYVSLTPPFKYIDNELHVAVYEKNRSEVTRLLNLGANINTPNRGYTPLMVAAAEGDLEMFKFLEEKGASLTGEVTSDRSNIFALAINSSSPAKENLLMHMLNNGYDYKEDPLKIRKGALQNLASRCSMTKVLDELLSKGIDVNEVDDKKRNALHYASLHNCFDSTISLIQNKIDLDAKDIEGKTAIELSKYESFKYFMEKRARAPAGH